MNTFRDVYFYGAISVMGLGLVLVLFMLVGSVRVERRYRREKAAREIRSGRRAS